VIVGANDFLPTSPTAGISLPFSEADTADLPINPARLSGPTSVVQEPYTPAHKKQPIRLEDPSNLDYTAEYDPETGMVTLYRTIGNVPVKLPYTMTLDEYNNMGMRQSMQSYWSEKNKEGEDESRSSFGNIRVGSEAFESIFGSNVINIRPQGLAQLKLGVNTTKIDNPTLQQRMRKTTTFDFDQTIQMNIRGTIGEKLKLGINYNTEATFDFENQINLEYAGGEDDIIKKIEAGNVSMPLPGTLITGSQSLFGLKTEMQFGKLTVSTIFSQQKGQTSVMNIQGGAQTQEFNISADQYDRNRHFFLSHYFRDNYNRALENLPVINSSVNITRVEVWITNRTGDFERARNILALTDLGEQPDNQARSWGGTPNAVPSNSSNDIYREMTTTYSGIRDINQITSLLSGLSSTQDYEKLENARLLPESEYTLNSRLGYISLNQQLNADEILAVAYEYTYNGEVYRVGEFSGSGIEAPQTLIAKLIKGTLLSPRVKTWNLMMKNIYSIGAYQVSPEQFRMNVVFMNDSTGSYINYFPEGPKPEEGGLNGRLFISIMELDNLNQQQEPYPDGTFDFVPGYTIIPAQGRIIFPVLEPFGSHMSSKLPDNQLYDKYLFQELYDSTMTLAGQTAEKNKYRLQGSYRSSAGAEISLNAFNIPRGSVIVTAGGRKLAENSDYSVDYTSGRIRILNQGLLESGTPIQVSLESQSLFNLQTKTLFGTHLDYRFNDNFNIGGTVMHLRERPLTQKVNYGNEPIANTIWGLNTSYFTESNLLTSLIDKLPIIQTKTPSSISFEAEFAQLIPGHPNVIDKEGTSYIDDFEGTKIPLDLKHWQAWHLASTPQGQEGLFPEANLINDLSYGFNRAKLAWYVIDPLFTRQSSIAPAHIRRDTDLQSNHYVREIFEREIFPYRNPAYGDATNISVLNLAFYPRERGPYNFATNDIDRDGFLQFPERRWGGIMRKIDSPDFEAANIDHIEFWIMDPFIYNTDGSHEGGDFYINLGSVSEDILRDSRKFFEQGMPGPGEPFDVDSTAWGYIPKRQSLVNAFSNDPATRMMQDVGLNGMNSQTENQFYRKEPHAYMNIIDDLFASGNLSQEAYNKIISDPASDDFRFYLGSDLDRDEVGILDRYKYFNNPEGNSQTQEGGNSRAATSIPDSEDINRDNTLSEAENYFQYRIPLRPNEMQVGQNYITDVVPAEVTLKNGKTEIVRWYQFKVPVSSPDDRIGDPDKRSIRYMRMFLHNFTDTIILRFASLDLIRAEWRKYDRDLINLGDDDDNQIVVPNENTIFEVSAVNIEENGARTPVNYVLPPGISRVVDPANPSVRELNEQSIVLKVLDLASGDARAVYKTLDMDLRQYRRLKMEIHAEQVEGYPLDDNEMRAFIRIGTDYQDNYYEYEIPLKLTPYGRYNDANISDRYLVWPEENRLDVPLELFQQIKLRRNDQMRSAGSDVQLTKVYRSFDPEKPQNWVRIKGNPNLANVRSVMIGVRATGNDKSVEVWMNELRLSDFNDQGGWAANSRVNIKLADLGTLSLAGSASTIGFGSIDQGVTERSKEDFYQYDVASNLELGRFLGPESRISIPFYVGLSEQIATPEYYPLDPDIPLDVALKNAETKSERDSIRSVSQDYTKRKSINFTNVRLMPKSNESPFYSPTNLSATYSYNETYRRNIDIEYLTDKNYRGILAYNFINRPTPIEPFKSVQGNSLALIRDFNLYFAPTQLSYRWELNRGYREEQLRNIHDQNFKIPLSVNKNFYWNRYFDLSYNLSRSLKIDFRSVNNAIIDEPEGPVNKSLYKDEYEQWKDSVMTNILNFGRTTNYQHNINATYNVPLNKLPYMDWTNATVSYGALYNWQQGPVTRQQFQWGNTIRNSNTMQGNTTLNFNSLYNKSPYLRQLNRPATRQQQQQQQQQQQGETVRFTQHNLQMTQGEPFHINHKLGTSNVTVRVFNETGQAVRGEQNIIDRDNMTFTPQQDIATARVMVTGQKSEEKTTFTFIKDNAFRLITSLRSINISYTQNNGTILPGYMPESRFMGAHNFGGTYAPGIPFMLGWQDRDFAANAAQSDWLTTDSTLQAAYMMNFTEDFTIRGQLEPLRGLRIDLNANRRYANNMSEYYLRGRPEAYNTMESGNFSMTFNVFRTSFKKVGKKGVFYSETFEQFKLNRQVISQRLGNERSGTTLPNTGQYAEGETYEGIGGLPYNPAGYPGHTNDPNKGVDGYSLSSQEVMIPAFLAAYSGKRASDIFLNPIPSLAHMSPNWTISYDGLSRIKWFQKVIRTFDIRHAYRSTYNVGNYLTNLDWDDFRDGFSYVRDAQGNFIPKYQISGVSISEQFTPIIQFNITWVNSLSTRAEIKRGRILNLSLNNNQLIENYSTEYIIGLGYRFDKMDIILGSREGQRKMSSDLNLRVDISVRDNFSIIRRIEEDLNQMSAGSKITTLKFTADYVLSDRFNMQLFYDKQISTPYISSTYPQSVGSFGVSFRFSLAQ
jgi:cell surface protein SprA